MNQEFRRLSREPEYKRASHYSRPKVSNQKELELKKELKQGVSLDANVWGPLLWEFLFFLCYNCVNDNHTTDIQYMFELLEYVMPCSHCRRSYSLFRRQVPHNSLESHDHGEQCAQWLWGVHDMVNQKLGKICISYDKLRMKQVCYSMPVTDFTIIDILCMMWVSNHENEIRLKKYIEAFKVTCRMLQADQVPSHLRLPGLLKECGICEFNMKTVLFDIKNKLLLHNNMKQQTMDEFDHQYYFAIVQ